MWHSGLSSYTFISLFPVPAAIFVVTLIKENKPEVSAYLQSCALQGRVLSLTCCSPDKCDPDCDFLRKLLNTVFLIAVSWVPQPWLIHANNKFSKQMSCEMIACEWHGRNKWFCVLDHADSSTRGKEKGELFSHSHCVGLSQLQGVKCPAAYKGNQTFCLVALTITCRREI